MNLEWVKDPALLGMRPPPLVLEWLTKPYILSQALRRICQTLSVKVIKQCFMEAFEDEYDVLQTNASTLPLIRQVFLEGDGVLLTYGRVVIPKTTYEQYFSQFESLNNNLIGETLLYKNPDATRGAFEYACVNSSHPIAKEVIAFFTDVEFLWARRSIFSLKSYPLLVTELFLPTLPPYRA